VLSAEREVPAVREEAKVEVPTQLRRSHRAHPRASTPSEQVSRRRFSSPPATLRLSGGRHGRDCLGDDKAIRRFRRVVESEALVRAVNGRRTRSWSYPVEIDEAYQYACGESLDRRSRFREVPPWLTAQLSIPGDVMMKRCFWLFSLRRPCHRRCWRTQPEGLENKRNRVPEHRSESSCKDLSRGRRRPAAALDENDAHAEIELHRVPYRTPLQSPPARPELKRGGKSTEPHRNVWRLLERSPEIITGCNGLSRRRDGCLARVHPWPPARRPTKAPIAAGCVSCHGPFTREHGPVRPTSKR